MIKSDNESLAQFFMVGIMMVKVNTTIISVEAISKSKSGRSLVREDIAIASENINEFTPSQETIKEAIQCFEKIDFIVLQTGVTLTLTGKPEQLEKSLKSN